jgi:hypothetical protein
MKDSDIKAPLAEEQAKIAERRKTITELMVRLFVDCATFGSRIELRLRDKKDETPDG